MSNRLLRIQRPAFLRWFFMVTPFYATMEQWERISRMAKHKHPIKYFIQKTLPQKVSIVDRITEDFIDDLQYKTIKRNNVFWIKSLKPGRNDLETTLLYTNFDIYVRYFEKTLPKSKIFLLDKFHGTVLTKDIQLRGIDYMRSIPELEPRAVRMQRLYDWWKIERPARIDPYDDERIWKDEPDDASQLDIYDFCDKTNNFYSTQDRAMLAELISLLPELPELP